MRPPAPLSGWRAGALCCLYGLGLAPIGSDARGPKRTCQSGVSAQECMARWKEPTRQVRQRRRLQDETTSMTEQSIEETLDVTISTFIGIGSSGVSADFVPYLETFLGQPAGILYQNLGFIDDRYPAADRTDQMYVVDSEYNVLRTFLMDPGLSDGEGNIMLIDRDAILPVYTGEDTPVNFTLDKLAGLQSYRNAGALFTLMADRHSGAILQLEDATFNTTGLVNIEKERGFQGDCGPATLAATRYPTSVTTFIGSSGQGMIAFVDSGNNRVRAFEQTTWPGCIDFDGTVCYETTDSMFNYVTGSPCNGIESCYVTANKADWCAFECKKYGHSHPGHKPTFRRDISRQKLNEFLNGTTYLDTNVARPAWAKVYRLKQGLHLNDGDFIPPGVYLKGLIRGNPESLRRLSIAEATTSPGDGVHSIFGNPDATSTLEFESDAACAYWMFDKQEGRCYLFSDVPDTNCPNRSNISSGTADCSPGMIYTLVGSGKPGGSAEEFEQDKSSMQNFIPYHPATIKLGAPRGILHFERFLGAANMYESDAHGSLLISDTLHSRLLRKPVATSDRFRVDFSLFLASPHAGMLQHIAQNEHIVQAISSAITDYLLQGARADRHVQFQLTAKLPVKPGVVKTDACDPEGQNLVQQHTAMDAQDRLLPLCRKTYCASGNLFGFSSLDCCAAGCNLCLEACQLEMYAFEAVSTSVDACDAFLAFRRCVSEKPECSTVSDYQGQLLGGTCSVNSSYDTAFEDQMYNLDIHDLGRYDRLSTYCPSITSESAFSLCESTYCDLDWFKILGVSETYLGKTDVVYEDGAYRVASLHIVGMDFSAVFSNPEEQATVIEKLEKLKMMELAYHAQSGVYDWEYLRSAQGQAAFQELYTFHHRILSYVNTLYQLNYHLCANEQPCGRHTLELSIALSNWVDWSISDRHFFGWSEPISLQSVMTIANSSWLGSPYGMVADRSGRVLVCDQELNKIVMISRPWDTNGKIQYVAGTGWGGYNRDDIPAIGADLNNPTDITIDNKGIFYVADSANHRIRSIHKLSSKQAICPSSNTYDALLRDEAASDQFANATRCYLNSLRTQVLLTIRNCLWCRDQMASCNMSLHTLCLSNDSSTDSAVELQQMQVLDDKPDCTECASANVCAEWEASMLVSNVTCDGFNGSITGDDRWENIMCQTNVLSPLSIHVFMEGLNRTKNMTLQESSWLRSPFPEGSFLRYSADFLDDVTGALDSAKKIATVYDGDSLKEESASIRETVCDSGDPQYALRYVLYYWYLTLSDSCLPESNSTSCSPCIADYEDDENKLVGAMYYTPLNLVPQIFLMPLYTPAFRVIVPSMCHPGCHLGQPIHLVGAPAKPIAGDRYRCCGTLGYKCGMGEGMCKRDADCLSGLQCVINGCPSGEGMGLVSCCLDGGKTGTVRAFRQLSLGQVSFSQERAHIRTMFT